MLSVMGAQLTEPRLARRFFFARLASALAFPASAAAASAAAASAANGSASVP